MAVASIFLYLHITSKGTYPWGSDSWYHLFKVHLLYESILSGNLYPLYTDLWYNGIQPLRYWAPLPYYILAGFEFLTGGNYAAAYNSFIIFVFLAGAAGWLPGILDGEVYPAGSRLVLHGAVFHCFDFADRH